MRKFLLPILAAALLLNTPLAKAQTIDLQFTVTNASSDTACDGELDIQCVGCSPTATFTWYDTTSGNVIGTGNHITGLCVTNTYFYGVGIEYYPGYGCMLYASVKNAVISGPTFQIKTSLQTALNDWDNNYLSTAYMKIQQVLGGIGPYWYRLYDDYTFDYLLYSDSNLTTVSNIVLDSLYDGYMEDYMLYIGDINHNQMVCLFSMLLDTAECYSCPIPLWASAQGYPTSDSTTCDGWAYATAYGGTPPYTYQFSSGATDSTETALCQGSYFVTVTDAASTVFNTTFIIGAPGTFYFSDPGSYNYIDTLYANASQNCGIDYSMPIDSFYIESAYAVSNWAYVVNWVLWQDTNVFDFTETYFIDSTGDYLFGLSVYCDARSSTFGSYSFFAGIHAETNPVITNIEDIKENNKIAVYPNPSNGNYHLTSSSKMKEYMIFDQLGRKLISKKVNSADEMINITGYGSGMYYLIVQYQDGTSGKQKLFKK